MKKAIFLLLILFLAGCSNQEKAPKETDKSEYLDMKSNLLEKKEFTEKEDLNCDITISIDRKDEERVSYKVKISNPKENMNQVKAIVVHNYYTEELFPSIGLLNKTGQLLQNSEKKISLEGTIETEKDIDTLDLELKVLIKYETDSKKIKEIYYKTT